MSNQLSNNIYQHNYSYPCFQSNVQRHPINVTPQSLRHDKHTCRIPLSLSLPQCQIERCRVESNRVVIRTGSYSKPRCSEQFLKESSFSSASIRSCIYNLVRHTQKHKTHALFPWGQAKTTERHLVRSQHTPFASILIQSIAI